MVVQEESVMEQLVVSGVTHDLNQARITLKKVPDQPGIAAKIFSPIAEAGILVDMIIQNTRAAGQTDLTFTVPRGDYKRAMEMQERISGVFGREGIPLIAVQTESSREELALGYDRTELK